MYGAPRSRPFLPEISRHIRRPAPENQGFQPSDRPHTGCVLRGKSWTKTIVRDWSDAISLASVSISDVQSRKALIWTLQFNSFNSDSEQEHFVFHSKVIDPIRVIPSVFTSVRIQ